MAPNRMHASEFGGHVSPPGHLKWTADKEAPELPPSELRRFADYDHRRFRYSRVALPCVLGLMAVAAVLMALTFLQGPLGGARDLTAPQPRDYSLANGADWDLDGSTAGLKDYVIGLRLASFGFCVVPLAVGSLAVAANPMPQVLRPVLRSCALALCLVAGLSAAAFALGLLPDNVLKACPDLRFNNVNASYNRLNFAPGQPYGPFNVTADNPYALCAEAPGLEAFALAADVLQVPPSVHRMPRPTNASDRNFLGPDHLGTRFGYRTGHSAPLCAGTAAVLKVQAEQRFNAHSVAWTGPRLLCVFARDRTACPTNTPVRTAFCEDFIVRWTCGGGGGRDLATEVHRGGGP